MSEPFLGEIRIVGFNFAPEGWFLCDGQTLPISQYVALFSLLGTTYGGNGTTTFQLPDLQGRVPLNVGNGAGLPVYNWGQKGGSPTVTLNANQLPVHSHPFAQQASSAAANTGSPIGAIPASDVDSKGGASLGYVKTAATGAMLAQTTGNTGAGQAVTVEPPYLALYFIIAYAGIFPSRP